MNKWFSKATFLKLGRFIIRKDVLLLLIEKYPAPVGRFIAKIFYNLYDDYIDDYLTDNIVHEEYHSDIERAESKMTKIERLKAEGRYREAFALINNL